MIITDENFTVDYDVGSAWVNFKVYEITGHQRGSTDKFDVPVYEALDAKSSDDETLDINKANIFMHGTIKWDGCSHLNFGQEGYLHICGNRQIKLLKDIIDTVYFKCGELMNSTLDGEFDK